MRGFADEEDLIPLSALQHWLFCPRQAALIHVERLWAEDRATTEGRHLHERVDEGRGGARGGIRIARGLQIRSLALGVSGKADVVELSKGPDGRIHPYPVEYKRGRQKGHRADEVQLCAQAICLEEAFDTAVPEGALFYAAERRRTVVVMDAELRALTGRVAAQARAAILAGLTPAPVKTPACRRCSMEGLCQPDRMSAPPRIDQWLARQIETALAERAGDSA
jgi:CRISPR-associated exonuclease Cas4